MTGWAPFGARPRSWWPDLLLCLTFVALTSLLTWPSPLVDLDVAVRDFCDGLSATPWLYWVNRIMTYAGQGLPLSIILLGLSLLTARKYRTIRPLLLFTVTWIVVFSCQLLQWFFARVAPHYPSPHGELTPPYVDAAGSVVFGLAEGVRSYPSGHGINAIVWYGLAVMLIGDRLSTGTRRLLLIAPPVMVLVSQTFLGWHWLTDAPAGMIIGILVIRNIQRIPWATIKLPSTQSRYSHQTPLLRRGLTRMKSLPTSGG